MLFVCLRVKDKDLMCVIMSGLTSVGFPWCWHTSEYLSLLSEEHSGSSVFAVKREPMLRSHSLSPLFCCCPYPPFLLSLTTMRCIKRVGSGGHVLRGCCRLALDQIHAHECTLRPTCTHCDKMFLEVWSLSGLWVSFLSFEPSSYQLRCLNHSTLHLDFF